MPNRTYLDLSNDIMRYESVWLDIANRYESVQETISSPDIDPILKEAVFYAMWNAKA